MDFCWPIDLTSAQHCMAAAASCGRMECQEVDNSYCWFSCTLSLSTRHRLDINTVSAARAEDCPDVGVAVSKTFGSAFEWPVVERWELSKLISWPSDSFHLLKFGNCLSVFSICLSVCQWCYSIFRLSMLTLRVYCVSASPKCNYGASLIATKTFEISRPILWFT